MRHGLEAGSWVAEGCGLQNRAATETGRKEGQVGVDAGSAQFVSRNADTALTLDCSNSSISCYLWDYLVPDSNHQELLAPPSTPPTAHVGAQTHTYGLPRAHTPTQAGTHGRHSHPHPPTFPHTDSYSCGPPLPFPFSGAPSLVPPARR